MTIEQDKLIDLIHRVNHDLKEWVTKDWVEDQFSLSAITIMRQINYTPGLTISEIARILDIAKSNVSNIITNLCKHHLVEKRDDPTDQRILRIFLTRDGRGFLEEIKMKMRDRVRMITDELAEERVIIIVEGLRDLAQALEVVKQREDRTSEEDNE